MLGFSSKAQQLSVGDKAPAFNLQDQDGNMVNSANIYGSEIVVIYFYPKDDTPGVSADDPASHKAFAEKYKLPFTLLSDIDNTLRQAFGVKADLFGLIPGRVTFIIDEQGIIRHVFASQTQAEKHIKESLEAIAKLKGD